MSYTEAIEAAGAKVLAFNEFGNSLGHWWAKIEIESKQSWIHGEYGSCPGCDDFDNSVSRFLGKPEYNQKLIEFGKELLDRKFTQKQAEKEISKNLDWCMEADEMLKWVKDNKLDIKPKR